MSVGDDRRESGFDSLGIANRDEHRRFQLANRRGHRFLGEELTGGAVGGMRLRSARFVS